MASTELIDAQFDRAVEIVQSLPKTGPIQTDYEEKLMMYSLYKQATVGNVQTPRPGMWDMLGRAKWDAWAKHKDLDPYEAKWMYIDTLLKVLRRYSDKTIAMNLVHELESYGGDPSNLVMSRSFTKSPGSDASGSTVSEDPSGLRRQQMHPDSADEADSTSDEDDSEEDEAGELPTSSMPAGRGSADVRPQSSMSSQHYRTPLTGSIMMSPPPPPHIPNQQPLPNFSTPSAFGDSSTTRYTPDEASHYADSRHDTSTPHAYSGYRAQVQSYPGPLRPTSTLALERAIENVQSHIAALQERVETLETRSLGLSKGSLAGSPRGSNSPAWVGGSRFLVDRNGGALVWDWDDLGMWSWVFAPLSRALEWIRTAAAFFAVNENRSPSAIIVRRLCLDVSFLLCVIGLVGTLWRRSGVRRREVRAALGVLWRAILGSKPPRRMTEQGV